MRVRLRDVAHARAGDKGDTSTVSLVALDRGDYDWLCLEVTPTRVQDHFGAMVSGPVVRHEVAHLGALNFVMHRALGGGVTRSLAIDPHGKARSSWLLEMEVERPG